MLTVLCSDIPPDDTTGSVWPDGLKKRLGRARLLSQHIDERAIPERATLDAWLAARYAIKQAGTVRVAAFSRFADAASTEIASAQASASLTLTAIPSYFRAGMDHIVLHPGNSLDIDDNEAAALIATANQFLAEDNIRLSAANNVCWLLHLPATMDLQLSTTMQAAGRNVHAYMPAGPDGRRLRSLLNELQMLWHEHPVNLARQEAGKPPVNTLWVEGSVTALSQPVFTALASADPILRGLARAAGADPVQILNTTEAGTARQWAALGAPSLLHWQGVDSLKLLASLLDQRPPTFRAVLCGERQWLEFLCSPRDAYAFWRRQPLTEIFTAETAKP